ncbi:thioredoxin domain-containing protein, partial [Streptomyces sp. NPDC059712]|uniref:thioredoxin domain-containing protein n=1 Tax=Streptomyces sp. NPDC059712 TaxID=3346919 RepID=UPI0036A3ED2D
AERGGFGGAPKFPPSMTIEFLLRHHARTGAEDAELAAQYFGVTEEGTFEHGASVLQLPQQEGVFDAARIVSVRQRLLAARDGRPAPGRDDKVVAAWNGLAIAALAETGAYFERPDLVEAAVAAADLLVRLHLDEQVRLTRTSKDGRPGANAGVLEDYADVAEGFLALASVTGEGVWLDFAGFLLDHVLTRFRDESGSLYDTAADAEQLIRRPQDPTDNATPSGWSAAAGALLTYAAHTGSEPHRTAAEHALGVVKALGPRVPRFIGWGLAAAEALLDGPREVAVVGPALADPAARGLHRTALLGTAPGAVVALGTEGSDEFPLLADRPLVGGAAAAYVCRNFTCDAPTTDPERLRAALSD